MESAPDTITLIFQEATDKKPRHVQFTEVPLQATPEDARSAFVNAVRSRNFDPEEARTDFRVKWASGKQKREIKK